MWKRFQLFKSYVFICDTFLHTIWKRMIFLSVTLHSSSDSRANFKTVRYDILYSQSLLVSLINFSQICLILAISWLWNQAIQDWLIIIFFGKSQQAHSEKTPALITLISTPLMLKTLSRTIVFSSKEGKLFWNKTTYFISLCLFWIERSTRFLKTFNSY